jgi:hypothetical protein
VTAEPNNRIKMSIPVALSIVAVLGTIIGSWYDTRNQLELVRAEIRQIVKVADKMDAKESAHEVLPGHAGVMGRVDADEKDIDKLERRMDRTPR